MHAASAQSIEVDSAAHTWTIVSGPVVYRLLDRDGRLALDYFGPAPASTSWSAAPSTPRWDLDGLAEGRSLAPPALRTISRSTATRRGVAELTLVLAHAELPLAIEARYAAWGETGVITRELTLVNRGSAPLRVERSPSLSLGLPAGEYTQRQLYGNWGQERQVAVERVGPGARRVEQRRGRSSVGYVPWLSLRNESSGVEYLAELAWSGNWWMQVEREPGTGASPLRDQLLLAAMSLRNDFGGPLMLGPGDSVRLPRVALTAAGDLDDAANRMHRYQREAVIPRAAVNQPPLVQYNTWFPLGPAVNIDITTRAADAAAALGAEVYILDSGWYTSGDWTRMLGDYEADPVKFPRGLEELSGHVHRRGMKFGLWVEIENVGQESRLFREHPDWCLPYEGRPAIAWDRCQLDFARPEVRHWARATVDRLVRRYALDWIKIDYNIDVGDRFDPPGTERRGDRLRRHIASYYAFLDELRAAYPSLIIENCASGGLRFDMGVMAHAHTTWLSDMVDPIASLQLQYGCTLQFTPEICNHWMVGEKDDGTVGPDGDPGWWDFMFRVPMNGQFGISSRIGAWPPALRERARANIALYKRIRTTIAGADVYHLTPPPGIERPMGWMAIQYVAPHDGRSVVLAYRLAGGAAEERFRLRGLPSGATFEIAVDGRQAGRASGAVLAGDGLRVALPAEWRAAVVELRQVQ